MVLDSANGSALADAVGEIAAQRGRLEELRQRKGDAGGADVQEQRLKHLEAALDRIPGVASTPYDVFKALPQLADTAKFEVPPSHRRRLGPAVRAVKRALVQALEPIHREGLRGQVAFNRELALALTEVVTSNGASQKAGVEKSERLRTRLEPLSNPSNDSRSSVRGPLSELLARQRVFNETATRLVLAAANAREASTETSALLQKLETDWANPLAGPGLDLTTRVTRPIWTEVFRRQVAFNHAITSALWRLFGQLPADVRPRPEYTQWLHEHEPRRIQEIRGAVSRLETKPTFGIFVLSRDPTSPPADKASATLLTQFYKASGIAFCASGPVSVAQGRGAAGRVPVGRLDDALRRSSDDFVVFLDEGRELAPHALAELALRAGEADVLYADDDCIDEKANRRWPFFKPEWSPDLFRSIDYISGFFAVRREFLDAAGGVASDWSESGTYDLLLRLSERRARFVHVPTVLSHRSFATLSPVHPEPFFRPREAHRLALARHLSRTPDAGEAEILQNGSLRVRYPIRGSPLVSMVVPFKDKPELLEKLTSSVTARTAYGHFEMLLISNNSVRPDTHSLLARLTDPRIRKLTWDHPFNYSSINNFGVREAKGEILLFLNNDIEAVDPAWLGELVSLIQRPEVGAAGAKLLYPDGSIQHAGVVVGIGGFAAHPFMRFPDDGRWTPFGTPDWVRDLLAVTGACLIMRREVFEAVGGFDERFAVCGGDVDLGVRVVRRGHRVVYTPHAKLIHHESATRRFDLIPEGDFWRCFLAYREHLRNGDPFYNPNLTLTGLDCSLREDSRTAETMAAETLARWVQVPA